MVNKHSINTFSMQVDNLLAGKATPTDDPLLSLASQMFAGSDLDPSPAFTRRLRQRLLSAPPVRAIHSPRRWSLAGTALIVFVAITLAVVWNSGSPSATKVLARAVDAIAVAPGQIEHIVFKWDVIPDSTSDPSGHSSGITEAWTRIDTMPEGYLAAVETAGTTYPPDDTSLTQPLYQAYYSPSMQCYRGLTPSFSELNMPESEQCLTFDTSPEPNSSVRYSDESPQDWINRMQNNVENIEVNEEQFNGHPVFSLTYQSQERHTVISADGTDTPATIESAITPDTVTLYVDRETYHPVGQTQTMFYDEHTFTTTLIILSYQVLDAIDLEHDPFTWPPE